MIMKKYIAFTLAEVMLVVAIIAIVAALTVPSTKKSTDNAAMMSKARAEMLKFDTALSQIDILNIVSDPNNSDRAKRSAAVVNAMARYLKLSSNCGNISTSNYCFLKTAIQKMGDYNPVGNTNCASAITNDGTEFALCIVSANPNPITTNVLSGGKKMYGYIAADVNGAKNPPNQRAKDIYYFVITEDGSLITADSNAEMVYESNSFALDDW